MTDLTFTFDVKTISLKVIDDAIKAIAPKDIITEAASVILDSTRKRFRNAIDPTGKSWPISRNFVLRSSGIKDSEGVTGGGKTLFSTGALFNSISVFDEGETSIKIGVNPKAEQTRRKGKKRVRKVRKYAIAHQVDGVGKARIRREFLGVTKNDIDEVNEFILKRLAQANG